MRGVRRDAAGAERRRDLAGADHGYLRSKGNRAVCKDEKKDDKMVSNRI
jgi:hypothetical protein